MTETNVVADVALNAAPPSSPNVVVVAGAGTGKTHALVDAYLDCLFTVRSPDKVLAITFTEKAAAEMRARVQRRLGDVLFRPENEPALVERAQAAGVDARVIEHLRRAVSGAPIHTFHAFCARVLRDHALAAGAGFDDDADGGPGGGGGGGGGGVGAGLDPAFTILEPDDERRLLAETAEACVLDELQRRTPLSPHVEELVARVALHGFGERKGLVECLVDLHGTLAERGLAPHQLVLAADASGTVRDAFAAVDDAVRAMKKVATTLASKGGAASRVLFVAQAVAALRAALDDTSEHGDPEARASKVFGELRDVAGGNWGGTKVTAERQALVAAVDALGAAVVDDFTRELAPAVRALLAELDVRQRREKHARGFLGFGDLLIHCRSLLAKNAGVRTRVKSRFARILVDEYQDTSPVQEDVLAYLLADDSIPPRDDDDDDDGTAALRVVQRLTPAPSKAFLVGDPKQSIYGFRGADSTVFGRALDVVARAPVGERRELAASRRSKTPIVDVANLVATHALPRGNFGVDASQLVALTALRGHDGAVAAGEHWRIADSLALVAAGGASGAGGAVTSLSPHELEAHVLAQRLREKLDAGVHVPRDVAILVRRGKAAVPIARALARRGIPSVVVGGDGFYVRPEVQDVVAALTLAVDPSDELAVLTVLRSPLVAVPDDQLLALYAQLPKARGLTWPRAVDVCAAADAASNDDVDVHAGVRERVRRFDAVLATVMKRLHEPSFERTGLARAVDAILDDAAYAAACAVESDAELRIRNLEKLRAMVELSKESALVTLARLAAAIDDPPPEPLAPIVDDGVRIMTIHQAKGLEFPAVILADAGSGLRGETDDVAFDAAAGLAVTARGRPIAACGQKAARAASAQAAATRSFTAIQRVRRVLRERNECELARLLYVAVTRARDALYVVGSPRRSGTGSLLGLLDLVRNVDTERFDALLPRVDITPSMQASSPPPPSWSPPPQAQPLLASLPPVPPQARRVRASEIGVVERAPTTSHMIEHVDEAERFPPRAAGRLAHSLVALVASEARPLFVKGYSAATDASVESVESVDQLRAILERAAGAFGVQEPPPSLIDRCITTLRGPVRALLDDGAAITFEEKLSFKSVDGGVVVEGKADLVARYDDGRTVVVELKLAERAAQSEHALLQVSAYAAALVERGERDVHIATWSLGDASPLAPRPFDDALRSNLDDALLLRGH